MCVRIVGSSHHDRNNDDDKMTTAQQGVHDVYGANVQWTSELSAPVELNRINGHLAAMKSAYERIERSKNPMARWICYIGSENEFIDDDMNAKNEFYCRLNSQSQWLGLILIWLLEMEFCALFFLLQCFIVICVSATLCCSTVLTIGVVH